MANEILSNKTASILFIEERDNKNIVIGAPHHSLGGVKYLPCPEHKDADENTGFIARAIADKLSASSIIACNYKVDANKNLQTDYCKQIENWKPKYLIEIHGHGGKKAGKKIIEISSGSLLLTEYSKQFAESLNKNLALNNELKEFNANGDFDQIYFKAENSVSIINERWISFHIELPPLLRLNEKNELPNYFPQFNEYLIATIIEICK
jgi:hypothetical protein